MSRETQFLQLVRSGTLPLTSRYSDGHQDYSAMGLALKHNDLQLAQYFLDQDIEQTNVESSIKILLTKQQSLTPRESRFLRRLVHSRLTKGQSFTTDQNLLLFRNPVLPLSDYRLILQSTPKKSLPTLFIESLRHREEMDPVRLLKLFLDQGMEMRPSIWDQAEIDLIMDTFGGDIHVLRFLLDIGYPPQPALVASLRSGRMQTVILLLNHGADLNARIGRKALLYEILSNLEYYSPLKQLNLVQVGIYVLERGMRLDKASKRILARLFFQNQIPSPILPARKDLIRIQSLNQRMRQQGRQDLESLQQFHDIFTLNNLMDNPVRLSSGKVYESSLLKKFLFDQWENGHDLFCPLTKKPIQPVDLLKIGNDQKTIHQYLGRLERESK